MDKRRKHQKLVKFVKEHRDELAARLRFHWRQRGDRYSQLRLQAGAPAAAKVEMHFIGG